MSSSREAKVSSSLRHRISPGMLERGSVAHQVELELLAHDRGSDHLVVQTAFEHIDITPRKM
jgi:hypothetical protein